MRTKATRPLAFGVCIDNSGYPASLEAGKLYPVIVDTEAAKHGYIRGLRADTEGWGSARQGTAVVAAGVFRVGRRAGS